MPTSPPSLHEDILRVVDIELPLQDFDTRARLSNFRKNILRAYEYKCTVCGFDVKLETSPIALEASHIKWQKAGGPDKVVNGLALCAMHHKLFDRGAFTLSKRLEILVSDEAHGTKGFKEWLMDFHTQKINFPQRQSYYPEEEFIAWHVKEVFKGDYREQKPVVEKRPAERVPAQPPVDGEQPPQITPPPDLTPDERTIFDAIEAPVSHIDTIVRTTQLPIGQVSSVLLMLELKRVVQQLPGKQFTKSS